VSSPFPAPSFETHRAEVRPGVELAYWHERPPSGAGPCVLLVHGWPETRRIWARNVEALAGAGFEVVVPDLRGFGDSGLAPDGAYDLAAHARDVHALVHDVLGHPSCCGVGGDLGGGVIQDLGLRFESFVVRQVLFNCILPLLGDAYLEAGLPTRPGPAERAAADYFVRQARDADGLAAELRTPEERRRYIATFYTSRFWATPGAFSAEEIAWLAEPFDDPEHFRASLGNYESALGERPVSEVPRWFERNPVPTLALYGPDDHVVWRDFPERCEVVFDDLVGPFVVPRAGHFLQWERAELLNGAVIAFLRDLTGGPPTLGDGDRGA
jgi:pimeloyl-ACP methyl ester carboxylesterase